MSCVIQLVATDPFSEHLLSRQLRMAGYEVIVTPGVDEAVEMARQCQPDLILAEADAETMGGADLSRALREDPQTCSIPVVLMTVAGSVLDPRSIVDTNVRLIVRRPFTPSEITGAINATLLQRAAA